MAIPEALDFDPSEEVVAKRPSLHLVENMGDTATNYAGIAEPSATQAQRAAAEGVVDGAEKPIWWGPSATFGGIRSHH